MLAKALSASAGLFVVSMALCFLPKLLIKKAATRKVYPLVTMFTAGIQLATILLDLIPHILAHDHHDHGHGHSHAAGPLMASGSVFILLLTVDILFLHGKSCSHEHGEKEHRHNHLHNHSHENIGTCNTSAIARSSTQLQALVVLFAISLHSFFEGLSVAEERLASAFVFGLLLHKILESFALGVAIFASLFGPVAKFLMICFYSLLTPLGIVLASALKDKNAQYGVWFNALSLGSLLFIVFIEMIAHSFNGGKSYGAKLVLLAFGYSCGCVATAYAHQHPH